MAFSSVYLNPYMCVCGDPYMEAMLHIFFCWVFVFIICSGVEINVVRKYSSSSSLKSVGGVTPVFKVTDYGAVGDGLSDDRAAFMAAWNAACSVESATLLLPSHHIFSISPTSFSGPCLPGLIFQVDGVLMAPDGPEKWPKSESLNQWIVFNQVHNMTLRGKGFIEGNGRKWWDLPCKPHRSEDESSVVFSGPCNSPTLIRFFMSYNLVMRELRIQNSPEFHIKLDNCECITIDNIFISSPKLSPNTDGIHIGNTRSVKVRNSTISNGDDCISIGPSCTDIEIDGVTCGPSHGISIGSLGVEQSRACVSDIMVRNVKIKDSDNGLRIKTWQGGSGSVSNITFHNIHMEGVTNCIVIDQYYCMSTKGCRNQTSAVHVKNVLYKNIRGTYDVRSPPVHFACSDTVPCTNITMLGVQLLPEVGGLVDDPFCWNVYGSEELLNIPPLNCLKLGVPMLLQEITTPQC